MPAPGEQYRDPRNVATNPFEETIPRISEYTAKEIATLQSRLDKQLGPEYISQRPGNGGGKVHYIAAEKVINLANEVFGFNGWSSQIRDVQIDFVDEVPNTGKVSLGMSIIVRVTLKDGTFHEDIGYGHIENCKGKAAAFEKAKKEAATDALKRALRNFGNVLGNCLYDKDYLQKVTKIKVQPSRWTEDNLHRHQEYAPLKAEPNNTTETKQITPPPAKTEGKPPALPNGHAAASNLTAEFEDDFGGNFFDGVELGGGNTEEASIAPESRPETPAPPPPGPLQHQPQALQRSASTGRPPTPQMNQAPNTEPAPRPVRPMPPPPQQHHQRNNAPPQNQPQPAAQRPQPQKSTPPDQQASNAPNVLPTPQSLPPQANRPSVPVHEPPIGFYTGRAAAMLANGNGSADLEAKLRFNPNSESPSIRKTTGFNHAASGPVKRADLSTGNAPNAGNGAPGGRAGSVGPGGNGQPANFINPAENLGRRIGAPGGGFSPAANKTSAYKPPTMNGVKRPYAASVASVAIAQYDGTSGDTPSREPLKDVSNVTNAKVGDAGGGHDLASKRLRSEG